MWIRTRCLRPCLASRGSGGRGSASGLTTKPRHWLADAGQASGGVSRRAKGAPNGRPLVPESTLPRRKSPLRRAARRCAVRFVADRDLLPVALRDAPSPHFSGEFLGHLGRISVARSRMCVRSLAWLFDIRICVARCDREFPPPERSPCCARWGGSAERRRSALPIASGGRGGAC